MLAPVCELGEAVLSPLGGGSTASELDRVGAHEGAFTVSVLLGLAAVVLFIPMYLGLAQTCVSHSLRAARIDGWVPAASMTGFAGIRGLQAIQLQAVGDRIDHGVAAGLLDHALGNPVGATCSCSSSAAARWWHLGVGGRRSRRPSVVSTRVTRLLTVGVEQHLSSG